MDSKTPLPRWFYIFFWNKHVFFFFHMMHLWSCWLNFLSFILFLFCYMFWNNASFLHCVVSSWWSIVWDTFLNQDIYAFDICDKIEENYVVLDTKSWFECDARSTCYYNLPFAVEPIFLDMKICLNWGINQECHWFTLIEAFEHRMGT